MKFSIIEFFFILFLLQWPLLLWNILFKGDQGEVGDVGPQGHRGYKVMLLIHW